MYRKHAILMAVLGVFMVALSVQTVRAAGMPVDLGITVTDFVAVGDTIYAVGESATGHELVIYPVNSPTDKLVISLDFQPQTIQVSSGNAYVTDGSGDIYYFDVNGTVQDDCAAYRQRYQAKFDFQKLSLTIPDVVIENSGIPALDGQEYTLILQQRGASSNFEVTFIEQADDTTAEPTD